MGDENMNYYIADLHLGHVNAIGFDNRPFADVTDLPDTLMLPVMLARAMLFAASQRAYSR